MLKKEYHDGKLFFFLWMQAQIKVNPYKLLFPLCSPAAYVEKEEIRGRRESKSCGLRVCQHSSLFSLLVTTRISKGEFFFLPMRVVIFSFHFFSVFLVCFYPVSFFSFFWWRELKIVRGREEKEAGDPAVSRPSKKKRVIASETNFFINIAR